ncbi:MAG TPA: DASS family sodium-coupled anion symporter [Gemmatimonadales bacterium]|nr:DASS family sodium-coupled anion symporter [Gemmatimonadales bacterium]
MTSAAASQSAGSQPVQLTPPGSQGSGSIRQIAGATLAPLVFVGVLMGSFETLSPEAHRLAAIMAAVVVLWVTEAIPLTVTALLGAAMAVVLRVAPAREVFAPFADPLMFLFIGAFILARAIFVHRLDRRVAYAVLSLPWVGARPSRVLFAFGLTTAGLSAWMSNTATTAMMFGIGLSILHVMLGNDGENGARTGVDPRYATGLMLMTAFAASIGGLATPVGTPPNVIGLGFIRELTGVEFSFFRWMMLAVPIVVVMFIGLFTYLNALSPAGVKELPGGAAMLRNERSKLGKWTQGQRSTTIAFGVTIALWVIPGIIALVVGERSELYLTINRSVPESVAALVGAVLLFILPGDEGERAITWNDAVKIDWGVVLLYGGGFALGVLSFQTGLAESLGRAMAAWLPLSGEFGLLVAAVIIAVLLSETTSNTASANMIVPVVISIATASGMDPVQPALGATIAASLGFMLPVSTPCNAIVYGSGLVPLSKMIKYGALLDIIGIVVVITAVWILA